MTDIKDIVYNINNDGVHVIPNFVSLEYCDTIVSKLKKTFPRGFSKTKSQGVSNLQCGGDYRMPNGENFFKEAKDFLNDKLINEVCEKYMESKPYEKRCMVGLLKHIKNETASSGGGWHVDSHIKQFKSILYLTDVVLNNGNFVIVKNSKNKIKEVGTYKATSIDSSETRVKENKVLTYFSSDEIIDIVGKRGTLILVDTSNIHRGKDITNGERYTFTNYFYNK